MKHQRESRKPQVVMPPEEGDRSAVYELDDGSKLNLEPEGVLGYDEDDSRVRWSITIERPGPTFEFVSVGRAKDIVGPGLKAQQRRIRREVAEKGPVLL